MKKIPPAAGLCLAALLGATTAFAQDKVRIGFVTDMSSNYAAGDGKEGAVAIQMAIEDFGGRLLGKPLELLSADHQNKADIAGVKAREWIDTQDVSLLIAGTNSGAALAMVKVAAEKKRVIFANGAGTSALTNEQCTPYTVHYAYDTVAHARGLAKAVVAAGGKSWFFLTPDYAFGVAMQADATKVINESGGSVSGGVRHPINASDFSSFLVQAKSSGAEVLAIANAGGDFVNSVKAAREFGITPSMKIAGFIVLPTDIRTLGLKTTEGMLLTTSWYWDLNDDTRAFAKRFKARTNRMPTELQAANYSAAMTWMKAATAAGSLDADTVMKQLKSTPVSDFFGKGVIRPDGRYVHDMHLMQVKSPAESTQEWDLYKLKTTLPGEQVFQTRAETRCPLWK